MDVDKVYDVKVADAAWAQLIEHARNLANVSVNAANKLVDEFVSKTASLKRMPERCPWLVHEMIPFQNTENYLSVNIIWRYSRFEEMLFT